MDRELTWNKTAFGDNKVMYLPIEEIWHPDVVLHNTYVTSSCVTSPRRQ